MDVFMQIKLKHMFQGQLLRPLYHHDNNYVYILKFLYQVTLEIGFFLTDF